MTPRTLADIHRHRPPLEPAMATHPIADPRHTTVERLRRERDAARLEADAQRARADRLDAQLAALRADRATLPAAFHVTRGTWPGFPEANCPCPKEPCGSVDTRRADPACEQHPAGRARTMRQMHRADRCPAEVTR
ncbi:hypothetical protein O7598_31280 [Micromonospora sp. WMMC241]|uniref:hypothetical protein n=1 Tax=Micromonospora sp. WMMC241 TaxID=3015159 RepID=UPI0022B60572|nr:hypothetical protein [Micromonospora sp. WMMC241]MCZ7434781.1 hypothetical protein [Micromonospora sp. WMMC241]MCZ7440836.1 hypothetical protein [Micromonospora sp. WMMC241]MCZ7440909.1 hypothetical protein [Micromonospora sp. WMMC241]